MKLLIQTTLGFATPSTVECEPQDAIGTLLNKCSADQGITDSRSVSLSYNGKVLDSKKRVKDYGLREGDTLQLVPSHRTVGSTSSPPPSSESNLPKRLIKRLAWETKLIRVKNLPIRMDIYNPLHWTFVVRGNGKWEGQNSTIEIHLSKRYPREFPRIDWKTKLVPKHPNIFPDTGWVCVSSLNARNWKPTQTLASIYDELVFVMDHPNYHHFNTNRNPARTRSILPIHNQRNNGLIHKLSSVLRGN